MSPASRNPLVSPKNITFNKINLLISILLSVLYRCKVKFIVNQYHKEWKGRGEAAEASVERGGMQRGGIKNLLRYILDVSLGIGQTITSGEKHKESRRGMGWQIKADRPSYGE